jgi:hypothetical protein
MTILPVGLSALNSMVAKVESVLSARLDDGQDPED